MLPFDVFGGGFATDDVDGDGFPDLTLGTSEGDVLVFEYDPTIEDYNLSFQGTVATYNAYLHFNTDDIDKNGKKEFWVGGYMFYQNDAITRITCFEADGDNRFVPVHVIDIHGLFSFFANNATVVDIDNDGTEELAFCMEQTFFIFKFTGTPNNPSYKLFYYKYNPLADTEDFGVYFGATMFDIDNDGYEEILINQARLVIQPGDNDRYDFTNIYAPSSVVDISENDENYPKSYKLYQNYPNPFSKGLSGNTSTTIKYEIPEKSLVTITVYNLLGEKITELVGEEKARGKYTTLFKGGNLPSGVYLITLTAKSKTQFITKTVKAVLIK